MITPIAPQQDGTIPTKPTAIYIATTARTACVNSIYFSQNNLNKCPFPRGALYGYTNQAGLLTYFVFRFLPNLARG